MRNDVKIVFMLEDPCMNAPIKDSRIKTSAQMQTLLNTWITTGLLIKSDEILTIDEIRSISILPPVIISMSDIQATDIICGGVPSRISLFVTFLQTSCAICIFLESIHNNEAILGIRSSGNTLPGFKFNSF